MSYMNIFEKIHHIIMAPYCTQMALALEYHSILFHLLCYFQNNPNHMGSEETNNLLDIKIKHDMALFIW